MCENYCDSRTNIILEQKFYTENSDTECKFSIIVLIRYVLYYMGIKMLRDMDFKNTWDNDHHCGL